MCVQEEERLVMELGGSAMLAMHEKGKSQANKKGKGKVHPQASIKKDSKCFFCKKEGTHEEGMHKISEMACGQR